MYAPYRNLVRVNKGAIDVSAAIAWDTKADDDAPDKATTANPADEEEEQRINDPESLKNGIIKSGTKKSEYTILLVGETGVGKTSVLSFLGNVLAGHRPDDYVESYDAGNEEGGSQSQSQTNMAKVYEFTSQNGVTLRILDTPGLADTRGIAMDEYHKNSIATAIKDQIVTVNAVLILANGTVPRLGAATDYALSSLSAIFPRTLADNIAIMFTNVSSPLAWNFDQKSLPEVLHNAEQFLLDNPMALQRKYNEMKGKKLPRGALSQLHDDIARGEGKALDMLADVFDWLDQREAQPTENILELYEQSQEIEKSIQNALARMEQANSKKTELEKIKRDIDKAKLDIDTLKGYEQVIKRKVHVQVSAKYHSTLCAMPGCYGNCHEDCGLDFSLDPKKLAPCDAMDEAGVMCLKCGHKRVDHRHYNSLWKEVEEKERVVDQEARKKYLDATTEKEKKEAFLQSVQKAIDELTKDVDESTVELGRLAEEYAGLSLSGSFASQVEKAIQLMELNIEKMRNDGSDPEMVKKLEASMKGMKDKLQVLRDARQKAREKSNLVTHAQEAGVRLMRFVAGDR